MKPFHAVAEGLRERMKSRMTSLYNKGTVMVEMEKEVEIRLSEINVKVGGMVQDVEEITEKVVRSY